MPHFSKCAFYWASSCVTSLHFVQVTVNCCFLHKPSSLVLLRSHCWAADPEAKEESEMTKGFGHLQNCSISWLSACSVWMVSVALGTLKTDEDRTNKNSDLSLNIEKKSNTFLGPYSLPVEAFYPLCDAAAICSDNELLACF
jgi:hypothetical protein